MKTLKQKIKLLVRKFLICVAIVGVNVSAYYVGSYVKNREWKQRLLEMDLAEYNVKTGVWQMVPTVTYSDLFGQAPSQELREGKLPDHSLPQKANKKSL